MITIDGKCAPMNPGGIAIWGFVLHINGNTVKRSGLACRPFDPEATNNVAEYIALIRALQFCIQDHLETLPITIKSDSQLMMRHLAALAKNNTIIVRANHTIATVKSARLRPLFVNVTHLLQRFTNVTLLWARHSETFEAHNLCEEFYQSYEYRRT